MAGVCFNHVWSSGMSVDFFIFTYKKSAQEILLWAQRAFVINGFWCVFLWFLNYRLECDVWRMSNKNAIDIHKCYSYALRYIQCVQRQKWNGSRSRFKFLGNKCLKICPNMRQGNVNVSLSAQFTRLHNIYSTFSLFVNKLLNRQKILGIKNTNV